MNDVFTWPVGRAAKSNARSRPPAVPIGAYAVGSTLGGTAIGFLIASLGLGAAEISEFAPIAGAGFAVAASGVAVIALPLELAGRVAPLPERRRQVPRHWLGWRRRSLTALAWGFIIGAGVLTHLRHAAAYALALAVLVVANPVFGAVVGAVYGASRGGALALTWIFDLLGYPRPRWVRFGVRSVAIAAPLVLACAAAYLTALLGGPFLD